jgi:HK97 family phage major capsid protein
MLPGMGAKFLTNLTGDLPLIQGGSFTAHWFAEDETDTTQKETYGRVLLQPKRVQATGAFSRKLLVQSSQDIEKMIEGDLIAAIAQALQTAIINGAGTNEPLGILNTSGIGDVAGGANGLAPTWANVVSLETKVDVANALQNSLSYLSNAKVRGLLKQLEKTSANGQYIWEKNELNGYPAFVTNAVPGTLTKGNQSLSSAIIFGDWSKLYIGQWGGLDIIVDPYSLKKKGEIEVSVLSMYDSAPVWPAAFAAMKDALTA